MGHTEESDSTRPFLIEQRSKEVCSDGDGSIGANGNVVGTYIHGLFHNDAFRRAILDELAERKGQPRVASTVQFPADEQYDRLAAHVRGSLDMHLIHRIIEAT